MLEYGFISYTGKKWANVQVDVYNALVKRIDSFGDDIPEYLLNSKHKLFQMFSLLV